MSWHVMNYRIYIKDRKKKKPKKKTNPSEKRILKRRQKWKKQKPSFIILLGFFKIIFAAKKLNFVNFLNKEPDFFSSKFYVSV